MGKKNPRVRPPSRRPPRGVAGFAGLGVDIVEISRISRLAKRNPRFLKRVFSEEEIRYCRDKKLKWQYDTRQGFDATPKQPDPLVDANGVLYISDNGKHLYAINPDGTLKWEYASPQGFATNAVIGADGTLYIGGNDRKLYALGEGG